MGYALKVVGVCPKDLIDPYSHVHFGSRLGVVLAQTNASEKSHVTGWNEEPLSQDEIRQLREVCDFLSRRGAIVEFQFHPDTPANASIFNKVCRELSEKNSILQLAICSSPPAPIPKFLTERVLSSKQAVLDYKFVQSHIDVKMEPKSLCEAMTPLVFDDVRFKIIDPYIFEMEKGNAQSRIDFLIELCSWLDQYNTFESESVEIEVFGRSYSKIDRRQIPLDDVRIKELLRDTKGLKRVSDKYNIKFVGLAEKPNGERLHLRCFYTSKYIIGIEDSFQKRFEHNGQTLKSQKIWYGSEYDPSKIMEMYKEETNEFFCNFSFYADEVWN